MIILYAILCFPWGKCPQNRYLIEQLSLTALDAGGGGGNCCNEGNGEICPYVDRPFLAQPWVDERDKIKQQQQ